MEYCPSVKRHELLMCKTIWMTLQGITWSKKKKNPQEFQTAWFRLYILKWEHFRNGRQISVCQEDWGLSPGREVDMVMKGQNEWYWKILFSILSGSRFTNCKWSNYIAWTHTHMQISTSGKSESDQWIVLLLPTWPWYYTTVLHNVVIG